MKGVHYQEILEAEDEVCFSLSTNFNSKMKFGFITQLWSDVLSKSVFITRAEMDVYDKIACKSLT
jgi:hypothetical protein